jgi:hypothetical protein
MNRPPRRGRGAALPALLVACASAASAAGLVRTAPAFPHAPPPAHTGGFGEPTCHACHFGSEPDAPGGFARLEGLPGIVSAGATLELTVVVGDAEMAVAGFQLAARFADGRQAGSFRPLDGDAAVTHDGEPAIAYAHHTLEGTVPNGAGTRRWRLAWTAPLRPGTVSFHVATHAGDGDGSPLGDRVRTATASVGVTAAEK